ncbi:cupin domain-containing protein [Dactylosporangium sp. NPDC051485]|uniref:cupin domain-containing protein n=1 Tax=Dactylosporangium sp. NPDC051485 TaxID=3154846 RepID=UPI003442C7CC
MKVFHAQSGVPGSPRCYHGPVWIDRDVGDLEPGRLMTFGAHFSPGSRTAWHRCRYEQVIRVLHGVGRAQRRGGRVQEIRADDVIVVPAGEWHWHGASPHAALLVHSVREAGSPGPNTEWGPHVTDAEYLLPALSALLPRQGGDRIPNREASW